jgi:tRNA pseudouridine synthase 10
MNSGNDPLPDPKTLAPSIVERCLRAAEGLEFETYIIGVTGKTLGDVPPDVLKTWKRAVKNAAGLELGELWETLGRRPDFQRPELLMVYDVDREVVEITVRSVYVYGRYRKLDSDLPQTQARWPCPECDRAGCEACDQTGRRYPTALEDLIGRPFAAAFEAREPVSYQLHGMGREDVDVRCLGGGRPFVLEVKSPRLRSTDFEALARAVEAANPGRVELPAPLQRVDASLVARIKSLKADKVYLAMCEPTGGGQFDPEAVASLDERLKGVELEQRTPVRVSQRRADMVRKRRVRTFSTRAATPERFEVEITAQNGTYVKELISGDGGRTTPSVASLLGVPCVCARLDVLEVGISDDEILGRP